MVVTAATVVTVVMTDDAIISGTIMSMAISDYNLTDFHSHCLPGVDDGAADIPTAVAMRS